MASTPHVYEVRPRKDQRRVDLMSEVLSIGRWWYGEPNAVANAIGFAMHYNRSPRCSDPLWQSFSGARGFVT